MPLKLRLFGSNPLPAAGAVALTILFSFSLLFAVPGNAIQLTGLYLEKGPPGGPYLAFNPCSASVLIGEEIRISASVFNNTTKIDWACVNATMDPGNSCDSCVTGVYRKCQIPADACFPNCVNGVYYFYPNKPLQIGPYMAPTNPSGTFKGVSATPLNLARGVASTAWVEWIFEANAIDLVNFNFFAAAPSDGGCVSAGDGIEGSPPPAAGTGCGFGTPTGPLIDDIFPCGGITIVSPFSASTTAYVTSFGSRPVGQAFNEDVIEQVTSISNVGLAAATITPGLACGVTRKSAGAFLTIFPMNSPGGCLSPETECGAPVLPDVIPGSGGSKQFTWTGSVTGSDGFPGSVGSGGIYFESRIKGTPSASTTLLVVPAPMTMAVTLWVDPDGAGPLPAVPLGVDPGDPTRAGFLYYMAAEYLQVRVVCTNLSGYTYDVHPVVYPVGRSSLPTYSLVSAPVAVQTLAAGAGNSKSFTWVYKPDLAPTLLGDCSIQPDPQDLNIVVLDRGLKFEKTITVGAHPFFDPTCGGGYISFNAPDIAFIFEGFPVTVSLRNHANRKVYMAPPLGVTLFVDDSFHAVDQVSAPTPLPMTWNAGETKSFTWNFLSTGLTCTVMMESVLLFPETSLYPCVIAASEQAPKCSSSRARVEIIPKPDVVIDHFWFTGPSKVAAFDQPIPLEMLLTNSSPTQTVSITSFCPKPFPAPVGTQGIEVDSSANHNWIINGFWPSIPPVTAASPLVIPPMSSATVYWSVIANDCSGWPLSVPNVYFGCFNSGWGNNMVKGTPSLSLKGVTSNTVETTIPVTLACSTFTPTSQYSVGQIISVYQEVENAGQNNADYYSATLLVESSPPGTVRFLSMTPAATVASLNGIGKCEASPWHGDSVIYRYDFEAISKGFVRFTTTLTAFDSVSKYHKKESTPCGTTWLRIADPGILEMTVTATDLVTLTRTCAGCPTSSECPSKGENCIKVDMSLKNRGEISLIEVQPSFVSLAPCPTDPVNCPGCDPNLCPGSRTYTGDVVIAPLPDLVPVLPPTGDLLAERDIRYYSWTFTPTALGCVRFYMQATSKDAATFRIWNPLDYSNCVNIVERRPIEMRLLNPPSSVASGQEFEVSIDIYNPGYTDVIMRGGEPALIFINPATGAAVTERFDVRIPTPVTVISGTHVTIRAKVRVLPGAPIGMVEIRIPETSMYAATDAVTGAPVTVVNSGTTKVVDIKVPRWALGPFVPNPFRPRNGIPVSIQYSVGEAAKVRIKVYTISGELVKTIWDGQREMGLWTADWDGRNSGNRVVASGIYILHLESPGFNEVKKLAVVK